jgi:hypothetical protein
MADKFRTLNPRNKVQTSESLRFRGIISSENDVMIPDEYVKNANNLTSFRLREMSQREGQSRVSTYTGPFTGAERTISSSNITESTNAHILEVNRVSGNSIRISVVRPIEIVG